MSLEISLGEYGLAMAQLDDDEWAIVKGVNVDEHCNYTEFICDTFSYKQWLEEVRDPKSWVDMDAICSFTGMTREDIESSMLRLFDALLSYYNYENFFSYCYGYRHYTLAEVLECIERDHKYIEQQKAA